MSFRDFSTPGTTTNMSRSRGGRPQVRVMPPAPTTAQTAPQTRIRRPLVLHGRVVRDGTEEEGDDDHTSAASLAARRSTRQARSHAPQNAVRLSLERRSKYAQLLHETTHYQKLVSDLEEVLPGAGESPQAAWRAKILMGSAQAVDQALWTKLYDYERGLVAREEGDIEVRQAQTACMKLHRDFKRSHKGLVLALTLYEKKQRAEMARLGAVGWSEREDEEDFYTKAMREREEEIQRMNLSMHRVKDLYQDLGLLVEEQQEPIDTIVEKNEESKGRVESGWNDFMCMPDQDRMCQPNQSITVKDGKWKVDGEELVFAIPSCGTMGAMALDNLSEGLLVPEATEVSEHSMTITSHNSEESPRGVIPDDASKDLRVEEDFHWYMPFETMAADIQAVHHDIIQMGKRVTTEVMAQTSEAMASSPPTPERRSAALV
jgi:hypothetical protein